MSSEALGGVVALGVFFTMWVVLPSIIHKRHQGTSEETSED